MSTTQPRLITASEVLEERKKQFDSGTYWPHDYNSRCGLWVSCDCPKCRSYYDPTGEESAKYMNMELSWFNGQGEKPSFSFSELVKESYLVHTQPGFYIGSAKKPASLEDVVLVETPPFPLKPKRILHIAPNHDWNEFLLSDDNTYWSRRTYVRGQMSPYMDGQDQKIPFLDLAKRLQEIFGV